MSDKVELERLLEVSAGFGTTPMLLTTDADGRPRASAVAVTWDGEVATVRAGHRSVANAAERALVSLLWPAPPGERFALLVDGEVAQVRPDDVADGASGRAAKPGGFVVVRATGGILHVVARPHA
jgi:hypothetical protein